MVAEAGLADRYVASLERSRELSEALAPSFPVQAAYAVALAYRIRYSMQMNAREAMHLIELRSGPQGHPSYRWVAQEMHRLIAEQAGHRLLAEAMSHVDFGVRGPRAAATPSAAPRTTRIRCRRREILQSPDLGGCPNAQVVCGECHLTTSGVDGLSFAQSQSPRKELPDGSPDGSGLRGGCCERRREAQGIE